MPRNKRNRIFPARYVMPDCNNFIMELKLFGTFFCFHNFTYYVLEMHESDHMYCALLLHNYSCIWEYTNMLRNQTGFYSTIMKGMKQYQKQNCFKFFSAGLSYDTWVLLSVSWLKLVFLSRPG